MKTRNQEIHVLLTHAEMARIDRKMREAGIRNRSAYIRKMALDGYVINLDMSDIRKLTSLLRSCSNNLNQIAKRANATGSVFGAEITDMQEKQEEIWEAAKEILARLSSIQ